MRKEVKERLDKWYKEYCRETGEFPTCGQMFQKAEEIASEYGLEGEAEEFADNF